MNRTRTHNRNRNSDCNSSRTMNCNRGRTSKRNRDTNSDSDGDSNCYSMRACSCASKLYVLVHHAHAHGRTGLEYKMDMESGRTLARSVGRRKHVDNEILDLSLYVYMYRQMYMHM